MRPLRRRDFLALSALGVAGLAVAKVGGRAALGVIRLIVENKLRLPLSEILEQALDAQAAAGAAPPSQEVVADLMAFFADRLKVALRDRGVRHDLVAAVFALGGEDDLLRLLDRVEALSDFLASEDGANLLVAHERATNIVRIEQKKDDLAYDGDVDRILLKESEELVLHEALQAARGRIQPQCGRRASAHPLAGPSPGKCAPAGSGHQASRLALPRPGSCAPGHAQRFPW